MSVFNIYYFFLLLRRSQSSTLFPYTTLFRSHSPARWVARSSSRSTNPTECEPPMAGCRRWPSPGETAIEDRKSTRLNSSHQIISYAVFCLKKKNNNQRKQLT